MATDSDRTTAELERQGQDQRAAAQKPNPRFVQSPEDPPVVAQRNLNSARGRELKRRNGGM